FANPRRITKKSELPPQNAENHLIPSVFVFAPSGRIQRFSVLQRTIVIYDFLPPRRFLSASKASRKWISTGDS
ncbi:hypothetical protein, partial [Bacteroides caecimuris]|uniref:hypothetical protein n=1 Tax=Bacteroides caecimuris TaxID=1796613 RepID=UPI00265C9AA6